MHRFGNDYGRTLECFAISCAVAVSLASLVFSFIIARFQYAISILYFVAVWNVSKQTV